MALTCSVSSSDFKGLTLMTWSDGYFSAAWYVVVLTVEVRWSRGSGIPDFCFFGEHLFYSPLPVAALSKAWVCGLTLAGIVGLSPAGGMDVSCECCVLWGRGISVGLITCTEKFYRVCSVQWMYSRSPVRGGHDPESCRSTTGNISVLLLQGFNSIKL
jgi:hypothetical protein